MRIAMAMCFVVSAMSQADAQIPTKLYDNHGNYRGQVSQEGSRQVERDKNGNALGYYQQEGGKTVHRDMNGNRRGYSTH